MNRYPQLFSPLRVGRVTLANRIVLPGLTSNYATADGSVTDQLVRFLSARAAGGAGLVSVEGAFVDWSGKGTPFQLGIHGDHLLPGLRRIPAAVRACGAVSMIQLVHTGRQMVSTWSGMPTVAPSAIPCPVIQEVPRELTLAEIRHLVEQFALAARRARDAGFDMVEFHAAHGYLMAGFLSPYSNRRRDAYGGDLPGRARFVLEVLARTRELVGPDYPISFRINGQEYVPEGVTPEMAAELAALLADHGADLINVSVGVKESYHYTSTPAGTGPAFLADLAAFVRQAVRVPVVTAGRILTAAQAEAVLWKGQADLVCMGRALIADPNLPRKTAAREDAQIIPCIGCNACNQRTRRPQIICPVNGDAGREAEAATAAERPRHVLILGSSLSGLEAARVAAARGHRVTVWEPRPYVGGLLGGLRARIPGLDELAAAAQYWERQLRAAGVEFRLGEPAEPAALRRLAPDVLVHALPGAPAVPEEPEAEIPAELAQRTRLADAVLHAAVPPAGRVVVLGGGLVGCETALWLARQGARVTVVTRRPRLVPDAHPTVRAFLLEWLESAGVRTCPQVTWIHVGDGVLAVRTPGDAFSLAWDELVLENRYVSAETDLAPYRNVAGEFRAVGDEYEASDEAEGVWHAGSLARTL